MPTNSKMMDAFVNQTYGSYENIDKIQKQADQRDSNLKMLQEDFEKLAISEMCKSQNINSKMEIPTRLKEKELDQKTETHPNLKNYDHSLEMNRSSKLGLIKLKEQETGSVEDMFNSMFD